MEIGETWNTQENIMEIGETWNTSQGMATSGGAFPGNGAARIPSVTAEYGALTDALDRIAKLSEELTTRLQPVLRQTEPRAEVIDGNKNAPAPCFLADNIRSDAERLHRYAHQLQGILDRLEV